jgi:hypothetical protein
VRLFVGDDWAQDHHDVEVMNEAGTVLAGRRLPEGVSGIGQLHELVGGLLGGQADASEVSVGIETDHGPWVMALIAAGCRPFFFLSCLTMAASRSESAMRWTTRPSP